MIIAIYLSITLFLYTTGWRNVWIIEFKVEDRLEDQEWHG